MVFMNKEAVVGMNLEGGGLWGFFVLLPIIIIAACSALTRLPYPNIQKFHTLSIFFWNFHNNLREERGERREGGDSSSSRWQLSLRYSATAER